jgi:hypothetical protein
MADCEAFLDQVLSANESLTRAISALSSLDEPSWWAFFKPITSSISCAGQARNDNGDFDHFGLAACLVDGIVDAGEYADKQQDYERKTAVLEGMVEDYARQLDEAADAYCACVRAPELTPEEELDEILQRLIHEQSSLDQETDEAEQLADELAALERDAFELDDGDAFAAATERSDVARLAAPWPTTAPAPRPPALAASRPPRGGCGCSDEP